MNKYFIVFAMLVSVNAFAVNPGFLNGVVHVTTGSTYTVTRSTDNTVLDENSDLLVLLPASPSVGDTYLVKDNTSDCDEDGFLLHSLCVESVGQAVTVDGSNEECLVACHEGAIYQYNGSSYVDIGDSF